MRVLKVTAEGLTTSFRYPHFMQQIHPTFPAPPPATIYGLICGALGEWIDPDGVRFAYHFTHEGRTQDKEHIILQTACGGRLPGTQIPKVQEGNVNPFDRDILFNPRLTLYLNRPEWAPAFRSPRYAAALGRSQDLIIYSKVDLVDLESAQNAYFDHTLLPHTMASRTMRGVTMLMPRRLDYKRDRAPVFSRYIVIDDIVHTNGDFFTFGKQSNGPHLVDPATPEVRGAHRGIVFLSFTGEDGEHFELP
jgi:CRISPR-associated protein Cas5t